MHNNKINKTNKLNVNDCFICFPYTINKNIIETITFMINLLKIIYNIKYFNI